MKETLVIGKIGAPHGITGEIKVYPITEDPARFESLQTIYVQSKEGYDCYTISEIKYQKSNVILKLKEVNDRNTADGLKNKLVEIDRADGIPLDEGEYYIVDLIGLQVIENEKPLGVLKDIIQSGATDIYVIKTEEKEILVPAIAQYVLDIDMENKRILVDIPQGLKEL